MVYWAKKRRVHLWRSGFYSTLPQVISQRTSYFSKAISNIVHYVSLMFPCTFTLLPLQAVSQSLPHLTNSWSLHGLLLAVDCQGEWEKAGLLLRDTQLTAEGYSLPFLTVVNHLRTCGVWQQQPYYGWCRRKNHAQCPQQVSLILSPTAAVTGIAINLIKFDNHHPTKEGKKGTAVLEIFSAIWERLPVSCCSLQKCMFKLTT